MSQLSEAQDLETPWEFIQAVENKFGKLSWDLACTKENRKAPVCVHYPEMDSLKLGWHAFVPVYHSTATRMWLNPPFDPITPWVQKCAEESQKGAEILLLSQASVDSNWYWNYVEPYATVYAIDRIKFVGQDHVYPKPLTLSHYHAGAGHEPLRRWRWKKENPNMSDEEFDGADAKLRIRECELRAQLSEVEVEKQRLRARYYSSQLAENKEENQP